MNLSDQTIQTPLFSLDGQDHIAKCVKCFDGDSIHIVLFIHGAYKRFKCRMNGIDTPSLYAVNPKEKQHAREAKEFLSKHILDKLVYVHCGEFDKYGRLLVDVYPYHKDTFESKHAQFENSMNQALINHGYAQAYNGDKKTPFVYN